MRNFKILALCGAFVMLLGGCGGSPGYQKRQISEDPAKTARFEALSKLGSPALVAKAAASEIAADTGGAKPHVKVARFAFLGEISAQGSDLIYAYSLSPGWASLKSSDRQKYLKLLTKDITENDCNAPSTRALLRSGVREVHRFFYDYPSSHLLDLQVSEEICRKAGL
ncbi:hypothetical protein [uncultured Campylobacter sp.]|uniref:hypothetical protein n=1 Tax=uncultured Campylobacter sp. TaxID=218934 RepID=UPI0026118BD2|nr:hypothetical protein [uncultured Campylobacter sp.]